jgi:hypothetical protein
MVHLRWQFFNQMCENTFAYRWNDPPPTQQELSNLTQDIASAQGVALRAMLSNVCAFREIYARNIDTQVANEATFTYSPGYNGLRSGDPVAASEAMEIVKRTGYTGYGQHGANRISGFVEGDVTGNLIQNALMLLVQALLFAILQWWESNRFRPAVAHIPRLPGAPPGHSDFINYAVVLDTNIDSQKTRLNAHGR